MSLYTCVIVNPKSANGATGRRWPELRAALDRVLSRWDHQFTLGPDDATRLARQAVKDGYEMIVCVGGDGTMNEVVTGLFEEGPLGIEDRLIRPGIVLAAVRQGTGGDFARYLGQSGRLPEAVQHLAGDRTRTADLGLVELTTPEGGRRRRAFLNIASFGLSGVVDQKVNRSTKALGGGASFALGLGRALLSYRPAPVRIRVDGELFHEGPMVTCAVANGQYFGGGMRFAPMAEVDDGRFEIVAQLRSGPKEILNVRDLYSGKIVEWDSARHRSGTVVEAEPLGDQPVLLDVDGEQPGQLPAKFTLLPQAVRLKVL
ncbi:MAG: diacylglycerol kinase family lipid kinase [Deltaproteobacteria bacterium]|nr:diacylglycerol kinase family lipid kinase [Deltaproteobacteria bacterium]